MMNKRNNNKIIYILLIIIIALISYIYYDKYLSNDYIDEPVIQDSLTEQEEASNKETKDNQIDNTKENKEDVISEVITNPNNNEDNYYFYKINTKDKIVSIIIYTKLGRLNTVYKTYNYDTEKDTYLTNEDLVKYFNISSTQFSDYIKKQYLEFYDQDEDNKVYLKHLEDDKERLKDTYDVAKKRLQQSLDKLKNSTYNYNDFNLFINENGKLSTELTNAIWVDERPEVSWHEVEGRSVRIVTLS